MNVKRITAYPFALLVQSIRQRSPGNHLTTKLLAIVSDVSSRNYAMLTLQLDGYGSGAANYRGAG
jgi:hypothetical protein